MFSVENADFIADKLAHELLPFQENREAYKNAEEAVNRRMQIDGSATGGRIEFDVDWPLHAQSECWYLCCADNGDGMTRSELQRYMTTLAVRGAGNSQGLHQNQGMGLKISGPTRHRQGVIIRSLKNGDAWLVQIGWNGHEYDLIPVGPADERIVPVPLDMFPPFIVKQGSGTVVTFLGNTEGDNTVAPQGRPKGWLFKYLNQRFYRLSQEGIEVLARQPAGDVEDWPRSREEASKRKSFNLAKVDGTATVWGEASETLGPDCLGTVELPGDPAADVPAANLHWWILPEGPGKDVTSRTAGGGSLAVLFQNELHDWRVGGQSNPFFGRLGVLFGKARITFVLEPLGSTITSDFARAHVLVGGKGVFESEAWLVWSDQFRSDIPEAIKRTMTEERDRIQAEDPERARRINDRLKEVMSQLRPRRFRRNADGSLRAVGPSVIGPGSDSGPVLTRSAGAGPRRRSGGARGIGSVLAQVDDAAGEPVSEVFSILRLEPRWVSEAEADNFAIVSGNGNGLRDRAAALAGEDAVTAPILLLNKEFRGYQAIIATVNEWANPEGDEGKSALIEGFTQEWTEQKMVEAVIGLRQLENGSTWLATNFDDALSPVALTAAFMADRYHTLRAVKRQAGSVRDGQAASTG